MKYSRLNYLMLLCLMMLIFTSSLAAQEGAEESLQPCNAVQLVADSFEWGTTAEGEVVEITLYQDGNAALYVSGIFVNSSVDVSSIYDIASGNNCLPLSSALRIAALLGLVEVDFSSSPVDVSTPVEIANDTQPQVYYPVAPLIIPYGSFADLPALAFIDRDGQTLVVLQQTSTDWILRNNVIGARICPYYEIGFVFIPDGRGVSCSELDMTGLLNMPLGLTSPIMLDVDVNTPVIQRNTQMLILTIESVPASGFIPIFDEDGELLAEISYINRNWSFADSNQAGAFCDNVETGEIYFYAGADISVMLCTGANMAPDNTTIFQSNLVVDAIYVRD